MNKTGIRIQDNHLHAISYYEQTNLLHFLFLTYSFFVAKNKKSKTITQHLPFEIEHPHIYKNKRFGLLFISFGEVLKKIFNIKLYWENCPVLIVGKWSLRYGQTNWNAIPNGIDLTLDTGHAILGSKDVSTARLRLKNIVIKLKKCIKHIHLHENNLISDKHWKPLSSYAKKRVITQTLFQALTKNRSYIFEIPSKG